MRTTELKIRHLADSDFGFSAHPPEVQHVEEERDLHEVDPPADVVVPEHDQAFAQLQAGLLQKVVLPVAPQDLLKRGRIYLGRVLVHQLAQEGPTLGLESKGEQRN